MARSYQYMAGVRVLSPEQRATVPHRHARGESIQAIATDLRVSVGTIAAIIKANPEGLYTARRYDEPTREGHPGTTGPRDFPYPCSTREVHTDQVDHIAREPRKPDPREPSLTPLIEHYREIVETLEAIEDMSPAAKAEVLSALGVGR